VTTNGDGYVCLTHSGQKEGVAKHQFEGAVAPRLPLAICLLIRKRLSKRFFKNKNKVKMFFASLPPDVNDSETDSERQ